MVKILRYSCLYLFLSAIALCFCWSLSSCGKGASTSAVGSNIQYQVVNLSPDLHPVDLYIQFRKNSGSYYYPSPSGYFTLTTIDTPFQIRPAAGTNSVNTYNIFNLDTILRANYKYTLFITGLVQDTVRAIFSIDTAHAPAVGRGKIRFLNGSPRSQGLNVVANGTTAFTNIKFQKLTAFTEIPSGNYTFNIVQASNPTVILKQLPSVTVQDGKLYTLYSYGLVGRTDTAAFGGGVIVNR